MPGLRQKISRRMNLQKMIKNLMILRSSRIREKMLSSQSLRKQFQPLPQMEQKSQ